jgi:diguanylate cyclase (GGDEF)-like protein
MGRSLVPEYQDPGLFDVLEERIFIIDVHTFALLFMNRVARHKFHLEPKDYQGRKCYEVLRRRDTPCMDCGGAGIRNGTCRWNTYNPIFNEYHQLTDTFIHYQGHEARVEMAVDITQQMQQSQELITALALETVMTEAVRILYASLDLPQAIREMLRYIGNHLMADRAFIFEIQGHSLYNRFEWCGVDVAPKPAVLPLDLIGRWMEEFKKNRVVCVPDIAVVSKLYPEEQQKMQDQKVYNYIVAPLLVHEKIAGFIGLDNPPPDRIKNLDSMLMTLAYFVSASMVAAENRSLLEALSYSDVMTGVANRNAFARDLAQGHAADHLQPVGVAYIDLNGLKRVNDSQGHRAGDQMIVSLAETIARFFRKKEIYRTGGDEFVVICSGITRAKFMDRVIRLAEVIHCNASVGFDWRDSNRDIQKAVIAADAAMYEQKKKYYMAERPGGAVADAADTLS